MNKSTARYVLGMEVMTPTGMSLDIASTVAQSDLARFEQVEGNDGIERFTFAKIGYTNESKVFEKTCELTGYLLNSLLAQLPRSLKPIPLLIAVPKSVSPMEVQDWLGESEYSGALLSVEAVHASGPIFLAQSIKWLDKHDAMMCISLDSLVESLQEFVDSSMVMSTHNPWGIIPSEGGAGLILCRKNTVDTLKLQAKVQLGYFDTEKSTTDRRGMYRLVQRASKALDTFGHVYTDMSNFRAHTEDYGFVLGAKAQRFANPTDPVRINDFWGTMGSCSSVALLAFAAANHYSINQPASLLMFDYHGDKGLMQILANNE
ncbi:hypothetical protein [Vibrio intestinalis]|uniref:hypothetical protein n=1 Tax=Vibrio intestinalis TaxID=2933291 RepID=UPI0021A5F9B2|nr:hypothetical protein [Vibrio intestinalis]